MKQKKYQHGFIGIGKMSQIILQALLKQGSAQAKNVIVSRKNPNALKKIAQSFKVASTQDNCQLASSCQYLWLGIKPFQAKVVLAEIKKSLTPKSIIISMMAGVSVQAIRRSLGKSIPIIRIMPNTPALLGMGVTGVFFSGKLPTKTKEHFIKLMEGLGKVALLKREKDFDAVTGLSGSGPAFVYTVAQGLIEGGIASGLTAKQARSLALETMLGAIAMLEVTGEDPQKLIEQVVSKKGTTEAGLKVLKKGKTIQTLKSAVKAAAKRSQEITKQFG